MRRKNDRNAGEIDGTFGNGGLIALFPSGVVASSRTMWVPPSKKNGTFFTARDPSIRCHNRSVFPGSNSTEYQIANQISATLRRGLLIHEIVHTPSTSRKTPSSASRSHEEVAERGDDPRAFMAWLRRHTALKT
jgi:hypothetical protein